jgi:hypothetical protein
MAPKANGKPGKDGPATSRLIYSRPPLRDSTKVISDSRSKAKPSEGTPQGPVDRGSAADYFGASPVASALNLPQERDLPKNRTHTTIPSSADLSKQDISTWQGIGHFYLALTPPNDNVLFVPSRNVLLTAFRLGRCKKDNY